MRKYLSTIHERPHGHKKRFAMLVSGGITLSMFAVWSLVNFGSPTSTVAEAERPTGLQAVAPFDDLKSGVANSLEAVNGQFETIQQNIYGE